MMKRRNFLFQSGSVLGLMALAPSKVFSQPLAPLDFQIKPLRNNVGIFTEQGGTIAWMTDPSGLVVVDSQFVAPAGHLIEELKKKSDKPFELLINTHHHADHTTGNIAFKGLVKKVVAHENSLVNQKNVSKDPSQQLFPDITFKDIWEAKVGSERIKAYYFGAAHTNGDSFIHFQNANIVHTGDLVSNKRYPYIDRTAGASIKNWIEVLDRGLKKFDNDTLFIFGHAFDPEKVTGSKKELVMMKDYMEKLLAFVGTQVKSGKSKEDILKVKTIPGIDFQGDGIERSLTAAYEELTT